MIKIPVRILLVDDEIEPRRAHPELEHETGEKVKEAYNGKECLDILEQTDIDVIILDIKMPGMDGIETLREIKRRHPLVEVILLTGHGAVETAVDGMKLGAFDYLLKPSDFEDLLDKIEGASKRKAEQEERIRKAEAKALMRRSGDV